MGARFVVTALAVPPGAEAPTTSRFPRICTILLSRVEEEGEEDVHLHLELEVWGEMIIVMVILCEVVR